MRLEGGRSPNWADKGWLALAVASALVGAGKGKAAGVGGTGTAAETELTFSLGVAVLVGVVGLGPAGTASSLGGRLVWVWESPGGEGSLASLGVCASVPWLTPCLAATGAFLGVWALGFALLMARGSWAGAAGSAAAAEMSRVCKAATVKGLGSKRKKEGPV